MNRHYPMSEKNQIDILLSWIEWKLSGYTDEDKIKTLEEAKQELTLIELTRWAIRNDFIDA